jgi:hypothetical protein
MCKFGKKKTIMCNWEGPYIFVDYKDGKGLQVQDHGSRICVVKYLKEQYWEHSRRDLQLYHFVD